MDGQAHNTEWHHGSSACVPSDKSWGDIVPRNCKPGYAGKRIAMFPTEQTKFFVWLCLGAVITSATVVDLPCGQVEGISQSVDAYDVKGELSVFFDIPFATPPTGRRRWMPATALEPEFCWKGTFNATLPGPQCWQAPLVPGQPMLQPLSEDCLTISVWTPNIAPKTLKPVVFWIYGGSLVGGSGASYRLLERLAVIGDIVLVAPNYRLGLFGYLALDVFSEVDPRETSGNQGFTDQLEALRWVQANIHSFGGDPNRVTLLGQSSGGTSILALLLSPESKGLFHAAIALSPSSNITMDLASAEQQNQRDIVQASPCRGTPSLHSHNQAPGRQ